MRVTKVLDKVLAAELANAFCDGLSVGALHLNLFDRPVGLFRGHEERIECRKYTSLNTALVRENHVNVGNQED